MYGVGCSWKSVSCGAAGMPGEASGVGKTKTCSGKCVAEPGLVAAVSELGACRMLCSSVQRTARVLL